MADEASLALVGDFLELEDFPAVVKLAGRFARLYPKSTFLDSFQYSEALGEFHLGQYDRAVEVAETIAKATYKDAAGADQPSPNKWQALYILGQIFDARRQPGKALELLPAGRRAVHRRRRAPIKSLHAQGPEAPRGHRGPARGQAGRGRRVEPRSADPERRFQRRSGLSGPRPRGGRPDGSPTGHQARATATSPRPT